MHSLLLEYSCAVILGDQLLNFSGILLSSIVATATTTSRDSGISSVQEWLGTQML
jgi:hypothetical protein